MLRFVDFERIQMMHFDKIVRVYSFDTSALWRKEMSFTSNL